MAAGNRMVNVKKRKQTVIEEPVYEEVEALPEVGIEMLSEDEDGQGEASGSDDGEVDEFPEIDANSDSEEDSEEGDDEGDEEDEDEEEDEEDEETDDDLHIFPKAKTITSDITGQLKKVYPEIEPDYDSDSSTEDVCPSPFHSRRTEMHTVSLTSEGAESRRKRTNALVRRSTSCGL